MGFLQKVLSSGAGKLIKDVGGVLDNLTTSKEEKLAAEQKIKELISNHELEMQKQVTNRWAADMKSDSWFSNNVRPLVLMFLVVSTVLMIFIDAGVIAFDLAKKCTDLLP